MELAESRREVAMMMITNAGWRNRLAYNRWRLLTCLILLVVAGAIVTTNAPQGKAQQGANGSTSFSEQVSNEELQVLGTHISPMINAGFTADGKWIVVAGTDGVTLHDAATSRCVHWFNGQLVEVAPDGKSILVEHSSGPPELWSIPEAKLIWRLPQDVQARDMHFSDDSQYIVCGYHDLLRIETREVIHRAPKGYSFDTFAGGDVFRNPGDASSQTSPPIPKPSQASAVHLSNRAATRRSSVDYPGKRLLFARRPIHDHSNRREGYKP